MGTDFDFGWSKKNVGVPTYDRSDYETKNSCFGMLVCPHCGNAAQCSEIFDTEGRIMLPRGNAPSSGATGRRQNGLTYIGSQDLSENKVIAKVLAVQINDKPLKEGQRRFSDVTVKISFNGQNRLFGLKIDTPNYIMLIQDFGADESKWVDREFYLYNEMEEFSEKVYPRVEPIARKVSARPAATK